MAQYVRNEYKLVVSGFVYKKYKITVTIGLSDVFIIVVYASSSECEWFCYYKHELVSTG